MYDELVKRLREWPRVCVQYDGSIDQLHDDAADAIEDLQKNLERSKEYETFWKKEANEALKKLQVAVAGAPIIIPAEEGAKTEEDSEPWLCLSCRHYPPSSTDGKPCSQCNPNEVWHSCYDPAEEGE